MKHLLIAVAFCLLFASFAFGQSDEINIVPQPISIQRRTGTFELNSKTKFVARSAEEIALAEFFISEIERRYGFKVKVTSDPRISIITYGNSKLSQNIILFDRLGFQPPYHAKEWYSLVVNSSNVYIEANGPGRFAALQTLLQLIPSSSKGKAVIPSVAIMDAPRFPYRGMHLDVSRHFMPVEFVKKYIDLMAQYKFNQFHWHLTDDQGWRIEIKKYPKLTEIGSKRPETVKGRVLQPYVGDGVPVEGFYTQEQIRDVIAYAKARYITVIPEIELPGHASAALAAYPQFGCKADYKYKVQTTWGIFKEVFCPTDETFKFLEDVLDETIALFPDSPYIHIGGDEVLKDHWKESPFVQELMKRENLKDEHEVQSYFIRRIEKFINSKGKKIIGWDEILEGGLAPNATVMSWRGMKGGIEAAKAKHDVIMTPTDYAYLDYAQGDPAGEPINIGGYVPLEKVYSFDPVPKELTADEAKYVIGGQGNIWTEYMKTPDKVEYMAFPRVIALAEVLWSTPENKNYADFLRRLSPQFARLDKQGVNYRIPEPLGLSNQVIPKGGALAMEVRSLVPGSRLLGTVDGSEPTENSPMFPGKLVANPGDGESQTVKTIVILPSGRKSAVYTTTFLKRDYLTPTELTEKRPGVTFAFVIPSAGGSFAPIITSGETRSTGLQQFAKTADLKQAFGAAFDGYINIPADGIYEFEVDSTWDATILIGGEKAIDDVGTAERKVRTAVLPLKAGLHKVSLRYNHRGGEAFFRVRWAIKGQNWRNLGGSELVH